MMNEKIKDWLLANTSGAKVGTVCGLVGIVYGVVKAKSIANKIRSRELPVYKDDLTDSRINTKED
jgi:hypothetical protein